MKDRTIISLRATVLALSSWLLPTCIWASVEVLGVSYELDEATQTAVVATQSNKNLESVIIPGSIFYNDVQYTVTAIADCAFLDCHDLYEVRINSASLTSIGYSAFERCEYLQSVWFSEGLTTIGSEAFKDCERLYNANLPSTLRRIGDYSFKGCTFLATINIPENVTYIGDQCLSGTSLKIIAVERKKPLSIKDGAFAGVDKENCILSVPEGTKEAYQSAKVWRDFQHIEDGILETGTCGENTTYTIYSDGTMTISGTGTINEFTPENVSSNFIRELTIEEGVTHIGRYAFSGVILFYGWYLTEQWQSLTKVNVPGSVTSIGQLAFVETPWYNNQPDGVVYAGKLVCGVKGIDGQDVILQEGTLGISPSAFWGVNIASLYIPSSVVSIDPCIYSYYDAHVKSLSYDSIDFITIDPENPYYDSRDDCNAIIETATNRLIAGSRNMTIPEGVTTIGPFALSGQTSVTIPASVTRIEEFAFINTYFYYIPGPFNDYIYFPSNSQIKTIKMNGCNPPEITESRIVDDTSGSPEINHFSTFGGVDKQTCILYVPTGSKEAYQSAEGWKGFANIEEYGGSVLIDGLWYVLDESALTAEVVAPEEGSPSYQGDVVIPESVEYEGRTYSVTSIGQSAFMDCTELTSVTIPPSVMEILENAFTGCSKLERVNISDLVAWCKVELGLRGGDFIASKAFDATPLWLNGEPIRELVIPEEVTDIPQLAFYGCQSLTSVYFTGPIGEIGMEAFGKCSNLTYLCSEKGIDFISLYAFNAPLRTVVFKHDTPPTQDPPTGINVHSTDVYVPYGSKSKYESCGDMEYYYWRGVKEFCTSDAIYYGLEPEGQLAKVISTDFYNMDEPPTEVRVPESIDCDGMSYTVSNIGLKAFELSSTMTQLTLPVSITSIDDYALNGCTSLSEVYCYADVAPAVSELAFEGSSVREAILFVPAAAVESYRAASPWNTFADIRPITTTAISEIGAPNDDAEVMYGIDGRVISAPGRGMMIVRRGSKVMKVMK